jgi:hypothetical protein
MSYFLKQKITIHPKVDYREVDDEMVILNADGSRCYGLNKMGAQIAGLLVNKAMNFDELCACLLEKYDTTLEGCSEEVNLFLQFMLKHDLFVLTEA